MKNLQAQKHEPTYEFSSVLKNYSLSFQSNSVN